MKRILVFLAFVFTVACYASPPPVPMPVFMADNVQLMIQDNQTVTDYAFDAMDFAFVDVGNFESEICFSKYAEQVNDVVLPQVMVIDLSFRTCQLNKPPSLNCNERATNFQLNKQNSNYSYPFGADYFVLS